MLARRRPFSRGGVDAAGARVGALVHSPTLTGVHVPAGTTDINAIVQANGTGTTFWFDPVVYHPTTIIVPKQDDVFQGQIGTVFDGGGTVAAAFAGNTGAGAGTGVTIQNIVLRNFAPTSSSPSLAAATAGTNHVMQDCEVYGAVHANGTGTGVRLGAGAIVRRSYVHDCGQYGVSSGGNVGIQMLNCEVARNNTAHVTDGSSDAGGTKFAVGCTDAIITTNYVHHNGGAGIWFDADAERSTITGNTVTDNDFVGIDYEISWGPATIANNIVTHNAAYYLAHTAGSTGSIFYGSDISVNTCAGSVGNEVVISGNTVTTSGNGIGLIAASRGTSSIAAHSGVAYTLTSVYVHDNTVILDTGGTVVAGQVGLSGALSDSTNRFVNNTYSVPSTSSNYWRHDTAMNLAGWRTAGQDVIGGKTAGLETGTNAATVATTDTGNATAWNTVVINTGCTATYDNTHAHGGSLSAKIVQTATASSQCYLSWSAATLGTLTEDYGRLYLWVDTVTGTNVLVTALDTTPATAFQIQLLKTAGVNEHKIKVLDGPGTVTATGTVAVTLGQWVRIEWHALANATTGSVVVRLYNSPESVVPSDTVTLTGGNTRANFGIRRFGIISTNVNWTGWLDDIVAGATYWPGPA